MGATAQLKLLWTLAIRSLQSHRVKSAIVGSIIGFGTLLVVVGTAFVDSIERAMAEGITASLAGHLQIYSAKSKDELALFGSNFMGSEDIGRIDDFSRVKAALAAVPGIAAVVPMGIDMATVSSPGELEQALGLLRRAVREDDRDPVPALKRQVREILGQMKAEQELNLAIAADKSKLQKDIELLARAASAETWARFDEAPLEVLEELDTKVAPLAEEGRLLYFRYVGTDLDLFKEHFDRFEIVDGEMVPPHTRGFLLNKRFYEEFVKNAVAKNLDEIRRGVEEKGQTIAGDPTLQATVRQNARQYRRITYHLDPTESAALKQKLVELLGKEGSLEELLQAFLSVNDENFAARYAFFYQHVAPMIDMYALDIGETMSVTSLTRSGFLKSVNVKLYGTFQFRGLDKSDLAGGHSLCDLLTFRELYGLMTEEKKEELAEIRREVGVADLAPEEAEDALFGGGSATASVARAAGGFDEFAGIDLSSGSRRAEAQASATFAQGDLDEGLALNAAVVLKDPRDRDARARIEAALGGAGLEVKVVDWLTASGLVGQFILVIQVVLLVAIAIIFTVALVIINNSMIMATMERVTEIGTMRAVGAQRSLVSMMFLIETLVLGILSGLAGAAVGVGVVLLLGRVGIGAPSPELVFLFGGPRLFPSLGASNLLFGAGIILVVSLISTFYPARIASRIQPVVAMQRKE